MTISGMVMALARGHLRHTWSHWLPSVRYSKVGLMLCEYQETEQRTCTVCGHAQERAVPAV